MDTCEVGTRGPQESESVRLLIVDDDEVFQRHCSRLLRNLPVHYDIQFACTGEEAEARYIAGDIDCVLLDYELPDTTGTMVMRTLQPQPDLNVPMIMLTGMRSEEVVIESLHAGVSDYLCKDDVTTSSLHRAIRNALDKSRLHSMVVDRNLQLEEANIELRERNEQIQRFCHVMSHEMKTPLTAAREFVSLVVDGVVGDITDEQRKVLSLAIDSCDELVGHFNDLMDTVRLDTGKLELTLSEGCIVHEIGRCIATVSAIADRKSISIGKKIDDNLPLIDMDAGRVRQVLTNLLTNAVKFTDEGGLVTVSAFVTHDNQLQVQVSDTGCGIPDSDLPKVFDRHFQGAHENVPHAQTGLGLGLNISREIVKRHGGTMSIQSKLGSGTTVSFQLPIC